jgi:hypothetical protein
MVEANKTTGKSKNQEIVCSELTFGLQQQTMVFFATEKSAIFVCKLHTRVCSIACGCWQVNHNSVCDQITTATAGEPVAQP